MLLPQLSRQEEIKLIRSMLTLDSPCKYYSPLPCFTEPPQKFPFQQPEEEQDLLAENCFRSPGFMIQEQQVGKIWMACSNWIWEPCNSEDICTVLWSKTAKFSKHWEHLPLANKLTSAPFFFDGQFPCLLLGLQFTEDWEKSLP